MKSARDAQKGVAEGPRARRGLRAGAFAMLALGALLLGATGSSAAVTTVSQTHTFPCIPLNPPIPGTCAGGLSATVTATCPPGQKAVGGGFWFDEFRIALTIYESRRVGDNAWRVSGFEDDTRAAGNFTAYAHCSPTSTEIVESTSNTVTLTGPRGALRSASAVCPTGTTAISGGWSYGAIPASYAGGFLMRQSERLEIALEKNAWRVTAVKANEAGNNPELTAHAYCAGRDPLQSASGSTTVAAPRTGTLRAAGGVDSPPCPATDFGSGGFQLTPVGSALTTAIGLPADSLLYPSGESSALARLSEHRMVAGGAWSTTAITYRPPPTGPLSGLLVPNWHLAAIAYCA